MHAAHAASPDDTRAPLTMVLTQYIKTSVSNVGRSAARVGFGRNEARLWYLGATLRGAFGAARAEKLHGG